MAVTNVVHEVKGNKLVITVDLKQDHGPSSSGKTSVVATTGGFVWFDDPAGVGFSLNVNRKEKKGGKK